MPFNAASYPMSGMSGMPSIAEKFGIAQQEGYTPRRQGSAVGKTPDISASFSPGPWSPPAFSAPPGVVAASGIPTRLSLLRASGGLFFAPHGAACLPQKRDTAPLAPLQPTKLRLSFSRMEVSCCENTSFRAR